MNGMASRSPLHLVAARGQPEYYFTAKDLRRLDYIKNKLRESDADFVPERDMDVVRRACEWAEMTSARRTLTRRDELFSDPLVMGEGAARYLRPKLSTVLAAILYASVRPNGEEEFNPDYLRQINNELFTHDGTIDQRYREVTPTISRALRVRDVDVLSPARLKPLSDSSDVPLEALNVHPEGVERKNNHLTCLEVMGVGGLEGTEVRVLALLLRLKANTVPIEELQGRKRNKLIREVYNAMRVHAVLADLIDFESFKRTVEEKGFSGYRTLPRLRAAIENECLRLTNPRRFQQLAGYVHKQVEDFATFLHCPTPDDTEAVLDAGKDFLFRLLSGTGLQDGVAIFGRDKKPKSLHDKIQRNIDENLADVAAGKPQPRNPGITPDHFAPFVSDVIAYTIVVDPQASTAAKTLALDDGEICREIRMALNEAFPVKDVKDYLGHRKKQEGFESLQFRLELGAKPQLIEIKVQTWDMMKREVSSAGSHFVYEHGRGKSKDRNAKSDEIVKLLADWRRAAREHLVVHTANTEHDTRDCMLMPANANVAEAAVQLHSELLLECDDYALLTRRTPGDKRERQKVSLDENLHSGDVIEFPKTGHRLSNDAIRRRAGLLRPESSFLERFLRTVRKKGHTL